MASVRRLKYGTFVVPHTVRRPAPASHSASSPRVSIGAAVCRPTENRSLTTQAAPRSAASTSPRAVTQASATSPSANRGGPPSPGSTRGQGVVLDLDELARVGGGGAIGRHDHRDRLADVADPVARQRRLQIGRVSRLAGLPQGNRRHSREVRGGEAGQHAGRGERPARIHPTDMGVRVGAPHDDRVHGAGRTRSST